MKRTTIIIMLLGALCAAVMFAGCNRDRENDQKPETGLIVTATIGESPLTKVERIYDTTNHKLRQRWETGDRIVGWYISNDGNTVDVEYNVKGVSAEGVATLEKVGTFDDPEEGTDVCVLCLGQKGDEGEGYIKSIGGSIAEWSSVVVGPNYCTIMTDTATVTSGKLEFKFSNQASIIGCTSLCIPHDFNPDTLTIKVILNDEDGVGIFHFDKDNGFKTYLGDAITIFQGTTDGPNATLSNGFLATILPGWNSEDEEEVEEVLKIEASGYDEGNVRTFTKIYNDTERSPKKGKFYNLGDLVKQSDWEEQW